MKAIEYESGRLCSICGVVLSIYNPDGKCFHHKEHMHKSTQVPISRPGGNRPLQGMSHKTPYGQVMASLDYYGDLRGI